MAAEATQASGPDLGKGIPARDLADGSMLLGHVEGAEEQVPVKKPRAREALGSDSYGINVIGVEDVLVRLAKCCTPVPGDDIVGYISLGKGITIHRGDCPNVRALMRNPERFTPVEWDGGKAKIRTSYEGLRTDAGLSNRRVVTAPQVLASILMFGFIYLMLFVVWEYVLNDKIQHGPDDHPAEPKTNSAERLLDAATANKPACGDSLRQARNEAQLAEAN